MNIKITHSESFLSNAFKESTVEEEREYHRLIIIEELLQFMKENGIGKPELAKEMGVEPSQITKLLDGEEDFMIDTLLRAGRSMGVDLQQRFSSKITQLQPQPVL